ncbi:VQ motif-containing protein 25-like [Solanum dulcamara]|uniref:VQ motif-containing protein 25-like n=1 Tax=Solanum dulcamara TaxID=45834 RepID=UPI00248688D9|nr:VQ motif-containing protein 25-like [Solanum dulcamara]
MKQITTSATTSLSCGKHNYKMHRDSHTISKLKPKIRIIHIIAPEIIKTDVENFRELVQRLTGKNAEREVKGKKAKKERKKLIESSPQQQQDQDMMMMNMLLQDDNTKNYRILKEEESSSHEEEGIYGSIENSSNGFLSGFGSMEGFIQDLGDQYPLFPNFKPNQITNMFGEMPLC